MSADHGHDSHDSHGHDAHGHDAGHGHDEHGGHGHGHEERWGDYNAQPPGPSPLPTVSGIWLAGFGVALFALLAAITLASFSISHAQPHEEHAEGAHDEHAEHGEKHE